MVVKNNEEDRTDLTRIEDLGEFEHEKDKTSTTLAFAQTDTNELITLTDLTEELTVELPALPLEESGLETTSTELNFDELPPVPETEATTEIEEFPALIQTDDEPPIIEQEIESSELNFSTEESVETEILEVAPLTNELLEQDGFVLEEPNNFENSAQSEEFPTTPEPEQLEDDITEIKEPFSSENFDDVKEFANNLSYGNVATGGNPPYSLLLSNIKFMEDKRDIIIILKEHGLINDQNSNDYEVSLDHGSLLLSQLPEYSAIYLAHKFRRFNLDIKFGLSEEIFATKHNSSPTDFRGLINKDTFHNHKEENVSFDSNFSIDDVVLSTFHSLEQNKIVKQIGVVSVQKNLQAEDLLQENLGLSEMPSILTPLLSDIKEQAYKNGANGVLGINYQVIPLMTDDAQKFYKIICTGNAVVLSI